MTDELRCKDCDQTLEPDYDRPPGSVVFVAPGQIDYDNDGIYCPVSGVEHRPVS